MLQHDVDDTKTKKHDHGKALPPDTPDAREADHQPPNTNVLRDAVDNTTYMVFEGEPASRQGCQGCD